MSIKEYIKGDSTIQGVTVHHKYSSGFEEWRDYDSEGRVIHYKDSRGVEYWYEYDSKGNLIYYKDSNGTRYWWDSKGNPIEDPSKVKELTLEEIAEKFGVSVESLRIKD